MNLADRQELEKLINGCIKGKRKYQEILHQTFYGKMLVVCMRYASCRAEAEDFLHEGFIKLYQKLGKYDYKGSFEGWVRRIIVNNTIDIIRRKREFVTDNELDYSKYYEQEPEDDSALDLNTTHIKAQVAIESIQELSPAYRAVFNMYVLDGLSHKEISEELGISVGTSKSNLSKAKTKLAEILREKLDEMDL